MGGEKTESSSASMNPRGSPPRGRGKERRVVDHHPLPGITPAQAGKRIRRPDTERAYWDHPRVGGEKSGAWWIIILFLGSPPHRRGKEYDDPTQNELIGITPAWAGKRCCSCRCSSRRWDHPRTGGEKAGNIRQAERIQGSPPRRRGKASDRLPGHGRPGIIPA